MTRREPVALVAGQEAGDLDGLTVPVVVLRLAVPRPGSAVTAPTAATTTVAGSAHPGSGRLVLVLLVLLVLAALVAVLVTLVLAALAGRPDP